MANFSRKYLMSTLAQNLILADGRWQGMHGIGRFSHEVLSRLQQVRIFTDGPHPLSIKNIFWQAYYLRKQKPAQIYFSPGFNPVLFSSLPYVFTIHDLIHLHFPGGKRIIKKMFYDYCVKPAAKKAHKIITVSEFSKQTIIEKLSLPAEKIVVVGNGVSRVFSANGQQYQPGFPYLLHVGNTTKPHKNILRLIKALTIAKIDPAIKLIFTGVLDEKTRGFIQELKLGQRVLSQPNLSEERLAEYYRGALGVVFPSLYEGFGLPVIEGMASGVPVLTSQLSALPEVAGGAALLVDPYCIEAIAQGMEILVNDHEKRALNIAKGLLRSQDFSWEKTAEQVQAALKMNDESL